MGRAAKIAGVSAPGSGVTVDRTLTYTSSGQLSVANALSGDLVANGGFEAGDPLDSWTAASGSISFSTSGPHSGANCCQISGASNGAAQTVPFTWVGQAAAIRCWVKAGSNSNAGLAKIYYEFQDKTGASLLNGSSPGLAASTTWQQIVLITGNAPAGTTQIKLIFCWLTSSPTGNWFVDDCSCEELPGSLQGVTIDPTTGFLVLNEGQGLTQDSSGVYIANGALSNAFFAALSIATTNLQAAAVTTAKIANAAVGTTQIANASITNALLGSAAVGTANIQSAAITTGLIANAAITNALLGTAAVGTANVQNLAVTNALLANASVGTANIQSLAVGTAQIANLAVTNAKINDLDVSKLNAGTINVSVTLNAATINSGSINSSTISGGSLTITTGSSHVVSISAGAAGITFTQGSFGGYMRTDGCLVMDGSGTGALSSTTVAVGNVFSPSSLSSSTGLKIVGTQVIDTSRNLVNISNIACSSVNSSGSVAGSGFNPTGYTGQTHNYGVRDSGGTPMHLWKDGVDQGALQFQVVGGVLVGLV